MEEFNYRYTRETSIVEFAEKLRLPDGNYPNWVDIELLKTMVDKAQSKVDAFKVRYEAIKHTGFERFKYILSAYKRGVYKKFHGIQTAFDDLFRFAD